MGHWSVVIDKKPELLSVFDPYVKDIIKKRQEQPNILDSFTLSTYDISVAEFLKNATYGEGRDRAFIRIYKV